MLFQIAANLMSDDAQREKRALMPYANSKVPGDRAHFVGGASDGISFPTDRFKVVPLL